MDLRDIEFDSQTFDGIWACASLVHLKRTEILPVLRKFYELLRPHGVLFLLMKEGSGEKVLTNPAIAGDTRYFSYVSTGEVHLFLREAGFSVLDLFTWDQKDRNAERPHELWISTFTRKSK